MKARFLILAASLLIAAPAVFADAPDLPADTTNLPATLPKRGASRRMVEQRFGQPVEKHAPVGGGSPVRPPITRWDYPGFSVFFENSHVVDSVAPSNPPTIYHSDQLHPVS